MHPQRVDRRAVEPTLASAPQAAAAAAAAASSRPQAQPRQEAGFISENVATMSINEGLRGQGRGGEDVDGSTPGHSSCRSDSTEDVDVDVDVDGIGDESSTASGTSVAEEGWESGHGLDNEDAAGLGLETEKGEVEGGEGGALPAAVRKRNSFRRAFDKARWVLLLASAVRVTRSLSVRRSLLSLKPLFIILYYLV